MSPSKHQASATVDEISWIEPRWANAMRGFVLGVFLRRYLWGCFKLCLILFILTVPATVLILRFGLGHKDSVAWTFKTSLWIFASAAFMMAAVLILLIVILTHFPARIRIAQGIISINQQRRQFPIKDCDCQLDRADPSRMILNITPTGEKPVRLAIANDLDVRKLQAVLDHHRAI